MLSGAFYIFEVSDWSCQDVLLASEEHTGDPSEATAFRPSVDEKPA